jgi:hypothetical protein
MATKQLDALIRSGLIGTLKYEVDILEAALLKGRRIGCRGVAARHLKVLQNAIELACRAQRSHLNMAEQLKFRLTNPEYMINYKGSKMRVFADAAHRWDGWGYIFDSSCRDAPVLAELVPTNEYGYFRVVWNDNHSQLADPQNKQRAAGYKKSIGRRRKNSTEDTTVKAAKRRSER